MGCTLREAVGGGVQVVQHCYSTENASRLCNTGKAHQMSVQPELGIWIARVAAGSCDLWRSKSRNVETECGCETLGNGSEGRWEQKSSGQ